MIAIDCSRRFSSAVFIRAQRSWRSPHSQRCGSCSDRQSGVTDCDISDIFILQRFLAGSPVTVENTCAAYSAP
jgi:hypothetical protein